MPESPPPPADLRGPLAGTVAAPSFTVSVITSPRLTCPSALDLHVDSHSHRRAVGTPNSRVVFVERPAERRRTRAAMRSVRGSHPRWQITVTAWIATRTSRDLTHDCVTDRIRSLRHAALRRPAIPTSSRPRSAPWGHSASVLQRWLPAGSEPLFGRPEHHVVRDLRRLLRRQANRV